MTAPLTTLLAECAKVEALDKQSREWPEGCKHDAFKWAEFQNHRDITLSEFPPKAARALRIMAEEHQRQIERLDTIYQSAPKELDEWIRESRAFLVSALAAAAKEFT